MSNLKLIKLYNHDKKEYVNIDLEFMDNLYNLTAEIKDKVNDIECKMESFERADINEESYVDVYTKIMFDSIFKDIRVYWQNAVSFNHGIVSLWAYLDVDDNVVDEPVIFVDDKGDEKVFNLGVMLMSLEGRHEMVLRLYDNATICVRHAYSLVYFHVDMKRKSVYWGADRYNLVCESSKNFDDEQ